MAYYFGKTFPNDLRIEETTMNTPVRARGYARRDAMLVTLARLFDHYRDQLDDARHLND